MPDVIKFSISYVLFIVFFISGIICIFAARDIIQIRKSWRDSLYGMIFLAYFVAGFCFFYFGTPKAHVLATLFGLILMGCMLFELDYARKTDGTKNPDKRRRYR